MDYSSWASQLMQTLKGVDKKDKERGRRMFPRQILAHFMQSQARSDQCG